jgi:hypothetical protein
MKVKDLNRNVVSRLQKQCPVFALDKAEEKIAIDNTIAVVFNANLAIQPTVRRVK